MVVLQVVCSIHGFVFYIPMQPQIKLNMMGETGVIYKVEN